MIRSSILTALLICKAAGLFAQAAGNSIYAAPSSEDMNYDESRAHYKRSTPPPSYYPITPLSPEATAVILNDSVIELGVKGLMNVKANSYVAIFGVSQVAETIDSCNRLITERINSFINRLQEFGVKRSDIYVDFVSQVPVFEYELEKKLFSKKYNEIPKGFELKKNIHIGYKKEDALDQFLLLAAKNEIYDVVKVDYVIDNVEAVYDSLRNAAIKTLVKKTEDMKRLGIQVFTAKFDVVAEDAHCFYPIDRYKNYTAFSNVSLGAIKKGSTTTTVLAPKTISIYYDKVSYGNFDVVINPRVIEPCAQFTYSLRERYTFKTECPRMNPVLPAKLPGK